MNDIELGQITGLAHRLDLKYASKTVTCAVMLRQMKNGLGLAESHPDFCVLARIAGRIYDLMPGIDEPRYSLHDYADGIANARTAVEPEKLLRLDDEAFIAAMVWLATDKRETYEERDHAQEPLEPDIYRS